MRFYIIFISFFLVSSCSQYQKVLKSEDPKYQYAQALEYYNSEDYLRSLQLFEKLLTSFSDREKREEIYYYYAYNMFHVKDYTSAAYHFNNFNLKFPLSDKNEEIAFMSSYCYYLQSPRYNLDQGNISNLNKKLEKKDFEIVRSYYDTGKFQSAIYAVDQFLIRFPETSILEEVTFIQVQAYYKLGKNSVEEKKEQRVKEAIFACNNFLLAFPQGNYKKDIESIYEKLKEIQNGL